MKRGSSLFEHQEEGISVVYRALTTHEIEGVPTHAFLLHDEMGLGKTLQALQVAQKLRLEGRPILVVAPSSCMCVWRQHPLEGYDIVEFDKHFTRVELGEKTIVITSYTMVCQAYKCYLGEKLYQGALSNKELERLCLLNGRSIEHLGRLPSEHRRRELLRVATGLSVPKLKVYGSERPDLIRLLKESWGLLIMDEVHRIRNAHSAQSRAVGFIQATYRLGLSGTPVMNCGKDLLNIWRYGLGLFHLRWDEITGNPNGAYVQRIIALTSLGRTKEDVKGLPLPKRNRACEEVILGWHEDRLHKQMYVWSKEDTIREYQLLQQTQNEATRKEIRMSFMHSVQKLRQVAIYAPRSYARLWSRGTHASYPRWIRRCIFSLLLGIRGLPERVRLAIVQYAVQNAVAGIVPTPKMVYVYDMLMAHPPNSKMLVFCTYRTFLEEVMEPWLDSIGISCLLFCGAARKEQARILKDFEEDPSIRVLLIVKTAGSEGLNLSCANLCVILDPHFNAALDEQAAQRIDRIGQQKEVIVRKLFMEGSIDEAMRIMQKEKLETSASWARADAKGMRSLKVQGMFLQERDTVSMSLGGGIEAAPLRGAASIPPPPQYAKKEVVQKPSQEGAPPNFGYTEKPLVFRFMGIKK